MRASKVAFLKDKPLEGCAPGYSYSDFATMPIPERMAFV
jgi:hypothetical protein